MRIFALSCCLILALSADAAATDPTASGVTGRIVDQSGLPLPGVTVTVRPGVANPPAAVTTDADGRFSVRLAPGIYRLTADLAGFTHVERAVVVGPGIVSIELTMVVALSEEIAVTAAPEPIVGAPTPAAQATVSRPVIEAAPLQNNTFDDVLPLVPNVVRGPDGLISVAGARAPQGQMLVNGFSQTDPVFGEPDIQLPLDPIASVQVLSNGYAAEYGRAAAGVTLVRMRPGTDAFRFNFNSFDPRLHFAHGGIDGVEAWEPNLGFSGPIAKGRLWYAQGFDYRFVRDYFQTVEGPQSNKYTAALSWTSIDWRVGDGHQASLWLDDDPQTTDHVDIGAFTPAASVPGLHRGGLRAAVEDRVVLGSRSSLEVGAQVASLPTRVTSSGDQPYVVGHDVATGAYFDRQDRRASREEATGVFAHTIGAHLLKAGATVDALGFDGTDVAAPVVELRSDGTTARAVEFIGGSRLAASAIEGDAFVQDDWTVGPALSVEAGVRYDRTTIAAGGVLAPRIGATWKIDDRTTLSGGGGLFGDKMMLAAAAFPLFPSRAVTEHDAAGAPIGPAQTFVNVVGAPLEMPRAAAWNVQLDRRFDRGFVVRLAYQERAGSDEPIVDVDPAAGELALTSSGRSHARSLETTVGYRSKRSGRSVYVSYVRSATTGDLNDFASLFGNLTEPFVQPNAWGPLPADVPNRVLTWAVLGLPARITIAPFLEVRNGFPYSPIDDEWRFVGPRNGARFPAFAAFDFSVYKLVRLPRGLPEARVGVKLYNLTGAGNWRDVQRDVARPDYGSTYNPVPREVRSVFEILWGGR
ncbi:MAG: carboxypeptidase regulatory-like domain-containing protein [Betaproteobacteria bacterium]